MVRSWFAQPWALWLLTLMPVLSLLGYLAQRRKQKALRQFGNLLTLDVVTQQGTGERIVRTMAASLALTFLAVSVAGPQWGQDSSLALAPGRDLVVILDVSRSMHAEQPSRLDRARGALVDLTETLRRRGGHRVALILFAGGARVACPLTHDYAHFREVLEGIDETEQVLGSEESGTRVGAALRLAGGLLETRFRGYQDILILSDGDDPVHDGEWRLPAAELRANDLPVHAIVLGDPDQSSSIPIGGGRFLEFEGVRVESRADPTSLEEIARMTGGTFLPAFTQAFPMGTFWRERIEGRPLREAEEEALPQPQLRYPWAVGSALVFLTLDMLLGAWRRRSGEA